MIHRIGIVGLIVLLATHSDAVGQNKSKTTKKRSSPSIVWVNQLKDSKRPLPPNTKHLTFQSKLVNQKIGYCIYLPPSYKSSQRKRYPVIYNLHGNGGNEFTSLDSIALLHEGIQKKWWPEIIMILPNGGHSTFYKDSADGRFPIESIFMTEFIPLMDKTYRTIADRSGRCIEGFSMGGRGSSRLAMKYPEMFCSLFCQAGNVPHLLELYDAAEPSERKDLLLGEDRANWEEDDVYAVTTKNAKRIKANVRIQIACGTADGGHIKTIRDWHKHLQKVGIDHTYIELEALGHQRSKMMQLMKPIWFNYHVESMRLAREAANGSNKK